MLKLNETPSLFGPVDKPPSPGLPELRPYQVNLLGRVRRHLADKPNARVLVQLPTGGGKTEIAAALADGVDKVTFVPHTRGLVGQTTRRFLDYGLPATAGSDPGGYDVPRSWRRQSDPHPGGIAVAAIETWANRTNKGVDSDGLLLIDEAHVTSGNGRRQVMVSRHKGPLVGFTATPYRLSEHEDLAGAYDVLEVGTSTRELIDGGWLADFVHYTLQSAGLRVREIRKGESDDAWVSRVWKESDRKERSTLCETAVDWWTEFAQEDSKTIVFAMTVEHAYRLQDVFRMHGSRARVIEGKHKGDVRAEILSDFRKPNADGGCAALINVNLMREGFDAPEADILLMTRPTKSLALFLQMAGRVLRPKPDGRKAIILDLVDNCLSHGAVDAKREWSLAGAKDSDSGESPIMVCRGPATLDKDGYVLRRSRNAKPDTAFDGKGCGAANAPGSYQCAGCGGSFRRLCSSETVDGCGRMRSAKRWYGRFRRWKMGACDLCGQHEQDAQLASAGMTGQVKLAWNPAKSGNGFNLWLAPAARHTATVWVGRTRRGYGVMVRDEAFAATPNGAFLLGHLQKALNGSAGRGRDPRAVVEEALLLLYRQHGSSVADQYGYVCPQCGERLYAAARFDCCYECGRGSPSPKRPVVQPAVVQPPAVVVDDAPSPEPEPQATPLSVKVPYGDDPYANEAMNRRLQYAFDLYREGKFNAAYNTLREMAGMPMSDKQSMRYSRAIAMVTEQRMALAA